MENNGQVLLVEEDRTVGHSKNEHKEQSLEVDDPLSPNRSGREKASNVIPVCSRVLVIDGTMDEKHRLRDVLSTAGYEVVEISSAIGSSRTLLSQEFLAVVADISTPGLSGEKVASLMRSNSKFSLIALVLVDSCEGDELLELQRGAAADRVVSSAQSDFEIIAAVRSAIKGRRPRRRATFSGVQAALRSKSSTTDG